MTSRGDGTSERPLREQVQSETPVGLGTKQGPRGEQALSRYLCRTGPKSETSVETGLRQGHLQDITGLSL